MDGCGGRLVGDGQLLGASASREVKCFSVRLNLERFWEYVPVFYLGALRNAEDEFSSRSQFWGRLLKAMEIPAALESRVQKEVLQL